MQPRWPYQCRRPGAIRPTDPPSLLRSLGVASLVGVVSASFPGPVAGQIGDSVPPFEPRAIERPTFPASSAKPEPAAGLSTSELPSDQAILARLPDFSTAYLRDLLGIYARLRNEAMISALERSS